MQATARQLVFHYRAGGDYAENGIDPGDRRDRHPVRRRDVGPVVELATRR
jgi:hypothetical protein